MNNATLIAARGTQRVSRDALKTLPVPEATRTHQPVSHYQLVVTLIESLGFRHIQVLQDEYAVSPDGARMFGVLDLDHEFSGCRFALGIRNANDRSMRLAMTAGYRALVCSNMAFKGDFQPVLAKHSKSFNLADSLAVGLDKMQRNFEPIQRTVEDWRRCCLSDDQAKRIIYAAFVEGKLEAPNLIRRVHELYFNPPHEEFRPRTLWSLSNAFTSSFKDLKPVKQFQVTAKLGTFLEEHWMPF